MAYDKEKAKSAYAQKLRDPRWQKMRLQIMERDNWTCQECDTKDNTLNVHHRWYERGKAPWEYPPECLVTLCEPCHYEETETRPAAEAVLLQTFRKIGTKAYHLETLSWLIDGRDDTATDWPEAFEMMMEIFLMPGLYKLVKAVYGCDHVEFKRLSDEYLKAKNAL